MLIVNERIHIGISACMYGAKVRYNEKGWDMTKFMGRDKEMFSFHPMCPEVMSGMGVPRPSIRIKGKSGREVWQGEADIVDSHGKIWTFAVKDACYDVMKHVEKNHLRAYIYMEGSPTCGVERTTLKNKRLGKPPGSLGALLKDSGLFLINGLDLQSPIKWWDVKRRLLAFVYLQDMEILNKQSMYDIWHHYKFICQEIDNTLARELGAELANLPKDVSAEDFAKIKEDILDILRKPSNPARIRQMLWKHYTYLRKHAGITLPEVKEPTDLRGMHALAKELNIMTIASFNQEVIYGQVPVIYRR